MALKDAWNALIGKSNPTEIAPKEETTALAPMASEAFPVVKVQPEQLAAYKKIPLAGLASLGMAFSQLPEGTRTIVQTVTQNVGTKETLFVGVNPKGIPGFLRADVNGTVGNIMQVNAQGKQVIAGRMRFKALDQLPIEESTSTVMPVDPMLMIVAVALMTIEKKLDGIQESVEEVLQFIKLEPAVQNTDITKQMITGIFTFLLIGITQKENISQMLMLASMTALPLQHSPEWSTMNTT